jgi:hypothetical protein
VGKTIIVAVVWRSRQQDYVIGIGGQLLRELVTLGLLSLVTPRRRFLRVGRALVGLIYDEQIPVLLPDALPDFFL